MRKLQVGDKVTCKIATEAYYSGYAGNPVQMFSPGMVGIVASVKVPTVCGPYKHFHCVDFTGTPYGSPEHTYTTWRVALHDDNIVRVRV